MFSRAEPAPAGPTPALESKVRAARERATAARRAVAEVAGSAPLDPGEVEALEAAHAEVLAAWEGSERRIGVGRARRRLEDAQLAEREILARMGFASYTEFMVSGRASGMPSQLDGEEARRELLLAEASLADAEAELDAAQAAALAPPPPPEPAPAPAPAPQWDAEAARGRLVETLGALRARAADLLGEDPGEDVAGALRERIATDPVSDLRMALDEVGVPLGEVLSRDEVVVRARAWVARQDDAARRQGELAAGRLHVEDELARLDATDGSRTAWEALARRRDDLREAVTEAEAIVAAIATAEERSAHDRDELARAEAELADAEAAQATAARSVAAPVSAADGAVDLDLAQLEAEARDAQTALDVAVSRLLPAGGADPDVEADVAVGRAEARVAVARLEVDALEAIARSRAAGEDPAASPVDADSATWRILARMASHREVAVPGGPGPAPLLVDEPFAALAGDDVARVLDALAGPASAVQVILLTARPEALAWAAGAPADRVGVVTAAAAAGFPAS
jgi:hypothetical protein